VVLTAAYLLWMMQRVFFGPLNEKYKGFADLNGRELFSLIPLVFVVLLFGVYPKPLIDMTKTSVEATQAHVLGADKKYNPNSAVIAAAELKKKNEQLAAQTAAIETPKIITLDRRDETVEAARLAAELEAGRAAASKEAR
jgi:hypothetical protein